MKVVLPLIFVLSLPASAQQFWNGTKYGMTPNEVESTIPDARESDLDSPRPPLSILIADTTLCGQRFSVLFRFRDGKLDHETLAWSSADKPNLAIENCIAEEYAKAYGKPTLDERRYGALGNYNGRHVVFMRDGTVVEVTGMTGGRIVEVFYDLKNSKL
jgi:hypothetical protein